MGKPGLNHIITLLAAAALLLAALPVRAEIWECVDKDSGSKRYTNIRGDSRGCKPMNVGGPRPAASAPVYTEPSMPRMANFPTVDSQTQRQRDVDRRRILDQELAQEEEALNQAKNDLKQQETAGKADAKSYAKALERMQPLQDNVRQHEDNIANLKKEIANIRQ